MRAEINLKLEITADRSSDASILIISHKLDSFFTAQFPSWLIFHSGLVNVCQLPGWASNNSHSVSLIVTHINTCNWNCSGCTLGGIYNMVFNAILNQNGKTFPLLVHDLSFETFSSYWFSFFSSAWTSSAHIYETIIETSWGKRSAEERKCFSRNQPKKHNFRLAHSHFISCLAFRDVMYLTELFFSPVSLLEKTWNQRQPSPWWFTWKQRNLEFQLLFP